MHTLQNLHKISLTSFGDANIHRLVRRCMESDKSTTIKKCTIGVHRADGQYAKALPREKAKTSHNFARILGYCNQYDVAAAIQIGSSRVGFLLPQWHLLDSGVLQDGIGVGARGSYAAICYLDDSIEGFLKSVGLGGAPSVAEEKEPTVNGGTEELWKPPSGDDDANGNDDGGLWVPPGGDGNGDDNMWEPPETSNVEMGTFGEMSIDNTVMDGNSNNDAGNVKSYHKDDGAAAADAFYSGLTRALTTRADSKLFHMRAFNGWVKATQIAELNPICDVGGKKRKRGNSNAPLRVLDLACGKGGDLGKWVLHQRGVSNYVGVDVARGSLKDAAKRAIKLGTSKLKAVSFVCADLGHDVPSEARHVLPTWKLTPDSMLDAEPVFHPSPGGGVSITDKFSVISVQFAIHYMMYSKKRARRFFKTVSQLLDVGGNLIATTIDARRVMQHMMNLGVDLLHLGDDEKVVVSVGAGCCKLTFESSVVKRLFFEQEEEDEGAQKQKNYADQQPPEIMDYGLTYAFRLSEGDDHASGVGEAVDLPEWLSSIPLYTALAKEAGLELSTVENFHEFYQNRKNSSDFPSAHNALYNMKVLGRDGSISADEWEVSGMYMAIKFTKMRDTNMVLDEDSDEEEQDAAEPSKTNEENDICNSSQSSAPPPDMKKYPMAMMRAKKSVPSNVWNALEGNAKKELILQELAKL